MKHSEIDTTTLAEERTVLAAERTFSAWLRTALAAMAGGLAILRLAIFKSHTHQIAAHFIGEALIIWGCIIIVLSAIDYRRSCAKAPKSYKSSPLGFLLLVIPLLIVSALLIYITLPS